VVNIISKVNKGKKNKKKKIVGIGYNKTLGPILRITEKGFKREVGWVGAGGGGKEGATCHRKDR